MPSDYDKAYYAANKERIRLRHKAYREANKEKIKSYYKQKGKRRTVNPELKIRTGGRYGPGFLYILRGACKTKKRWYKYGHTINWSNRRARYSGPTRPSPLFFLRPVRNQLHAEYVLGSFLRAHGYYVPPNCKDTSEWLLRNEDWTECV